MSNKCLAISTFTMPAALAAADHLLGHAPEWVGDPNNPQQLAWLQSFRRRADIARSIEQVASHATDRAVSHVEWLRARGWEAQITQGSANDIYLGATLNVFARWRTVGEAYREGGCDRVLLKKDVVTSTRTRGEHPVVEVFTRDDRFTFCFQQVDAAPTDQQALADHALSMVCRHAHESTYLDFPMVDAAWRDDAAHMLGLRSGPNVVTQACEQLRLELNEIGGRASAAAEIAVTRGMTNVVKIDGPFVVAVNRNGTPRNGEKVLFAAYCDRDSWRKPAPHSL